MDKFSQKYSNIYEKQNSAILSNSKSDIISEFSRLENKTPDNKEHFIHKTPSPYSYQIGEKKLIVSDISEHQDFSINLDHNKIEDLEINLQNKGICDLQIQLICSLLIALKEQELQHLTMNFANNDCLGDRGIFKIIQQLRFFKKIRHFSVNLEYCNVTDYTIDQLFQKIDNFSELQNLNLYIKNTSISEVCVNGLKQILAHTKFRSAIISDYENNVYFMHNEPAPYLPPNHFKQQQQIQLHIQQQQAKEHIQQIEQENYCENIQKPDSLKRGFNQFQKTISDFEQKVEENHQLQIKANTEKSMNYKYGKGLQLMQKFGYVVGTGLGKNKEGILNPVPAINKTYFGDKITKRAKRDKNQEYIIFERKQVIGGVDLTQDTEITDANSEKDGQEIAVNGDRNSGKKQSPEQFSPLSQKNTVIFNTVLNFNGDTQINNQQPSQLCSINQNNFPESKKVLVPNNSLQNKMTFQKVQQQYKDQQQKQNSPQSSKKI